MATLDRFILADDVRSIKGWTIRQGMPMKCVDALAACNLGGGHLVESGLELFVGRHRKIRAVILPL